MEDSWFDKYQFLRPLGMGGMGVVYLAFSKELQKQVIVKQLISRPKDTLERSESIRLFKREVQLLQKLSHPAIVSTYDYHVTHDDKYFFVMEYVDGKDLNQIIKSNGCLSQEVVVEIGCQCCKVLTYLHEFEEPIIYRDLKPSNLMLNKTGKIVFIDFGIARILDTTNKATKVITAGYSPPEQYYGKPVPRSDLYSLGVTLGFLLTAHKPKNLNQFIPSNYADNIDKELDDIIKQLTSYNVEDRPKSARELDSKLEAIYKRLVSKNSQSQTQSIQSNSLISLFKKLFNNEND